MRVDDPPELLRRLDVGQKGPGSPRWNGDNRRIVAPHRNGVRIELELDGMFVGKANGAQTIAERD